MATFSGSILMNLRAIEGHAFLLASQLNRWNLSIVLYAIRLVYSVWFCLTTCVCVFVSVCECEWVSEWSYAMLVAPWELRKFWHNKPLSLRENRESDAIATGESYIRHARLDAQMQSNSNALSTKRLDSIQLHRWICFLIFHDANEASNSNVTDQVATCHS